MRYGISQKNISDLVMLLMFSITVVLYTNNTSTLKSSIINGFAFISLLMFYVSFLGIDNNSWGNTLDAKSNDLEYLRKYRQGLFRVAHIASYFFTFLSFYYYYIFSYSRKKKHIVLSLLFFISVLLVGSRAPLFAVIIGLGIANFKFKYLKYIILIVIIVVLITLNIDSVLSLTKGSVLFQYFSIFKTIISNFGRLSRVLIWTSFFEEVIKFNPLDILFGKGVNNAMIVNETKRLGKIWFHNDFLNILYSFGVINFILYIIFYINIFRNNKILINNNVLIKTMFVSMIFLAFFNGFYLYYVMFLLYIFFKIIDIEKKRNFVIN